VSASRRRKVRQGARSQPRHRRFLMLCFSFQGMKW
jgi:hypothetical protein